MRGPTLVLVLACIPLVALAPAAEAYHPDVLSRTLCPIGSSLCTLASTVDRLIDDYPPHAPYARVLP